LVVHLRRAHLCVRVQHPIDDLSKLSVKRKIKVRSFSRRDVKRRFAESGASNKQEIAVAIANRFSELAPRLPRFRKPWMSEDYRMSIFDAVALAIAFFQFQKEKRARA
jgi:Holliday junction resolvasome RuvABC endonuclease subunit